MSIRNFILNRLSKLASDSDVSSDRRVHRQVVSSNKLWKTIVELQIQHNVLEGTQKMKVIPYEKSYNESRKHKKL